MNYVSYGEMIQFVIMLAAVATFVFLISKKK